MILKDTYFYLEQKYTFPFFLKHLELLYFV